MKDYLSWIFTRWYFYGIVVIKFFLSISPEGTILPMSAYGRVLLESFIFIFVTFSVVRLFFYIIGGVIHRRKR